MARILILEDQVELAQAWLTSLSASGHQVTTVTNYADFENAFQNDRVDLMVIDLSLGGERGSPNYSGLVALSDNLLRTSLRGQRIPCIVVSGHFSRQDESDHLRKRVRPFNPDRVLAKPFTIGQLHQAIDELLE